MKTLGVVFSLTIFRLQMPMCIKQDMRDLPERAHQAKRIVQTRELVTAILLAASLFITFTVWKNARDIADQTLRTNFQFQVREANDRIQQRVLVYEQLLRATSGLFLISPGVRREDFRTFVDALYLGDYYPGIQGIGFSVIVPPAEKERHEGAVRREGFPDYHIQPEGNRDVYTSIVYLEPFNVRNRRAFGYDMYAEPVRRAAMDSARDTGKAAVSGIVTLVQESKTQAQPGFLMYVPVYRNHTVIETVAQRRANIIGWVYAPFRFNDFMQGLSNQLSSDLDLEIYDESISDFTRMYDSDKEINATDAKRNLSSFNQLVAANRNWSVAAAATPAFEKRMSSDRPQLLLQAGISISLMIALLVWLFLDDRARALRAADQAMQLALYDPLTGLPNRKLLDERLNQAIAKAKRNRSRIALLFIDLDKFKPVNDNFGHAYGDLLLKDVAKRLQTCMRESDTACRLGGDEFVALLSDIEDKAAAQNVANKILHQLTLPYEIAGHVFDISASIGAAVYPDDAPDSRTLIKCADMAMYDAKNSGRANVKLVCSEITDAA